MQGIIQRFFKHVQVSENGCWDWLGSKDDSGYGQFNLNGKIDRAHRSIHTLLKGQIPTSLQIDHLCRNHSCVNPDHLEVVTAQENIREGWDQQQLTLEKLIVSMVMNSMRKIPIGKITIAIVKFVIRSVVKSI